MRTFKRLIALTFMLLFLLSMLTVGVLAADTVPSGYTAISTPEQLDNIRNNLSGKYILTADIDLTEALAKGGSLYDAKGWIAIGYLSSGNTSPFTGVLDGNGHTISGITAKGGTGIAHLIHTNQGTITNLTISGTFSSGGVFCLKNEGLIQNCHNKATITTSVYTSSETNYGGLVNTNSASGLVEYCSNQADITGDVYSNGGMNDKALRIGGIVGGNAGTVRKCYNSGNLTCVGHKATSAYVAGIVGYGDSKSVIENCYNTGKIYANMTESGYDSAYNVAAAGILATVYYQNSTTIKYCYNAGSISMSSGYHNDYLGAIAGFHAKSTFTNCYYLSGSCGQATYSGENSSIVKLTENQMRTQSAFTGFDFTGVWSMGSGTYRYPVLKARCTHAVDKVNATPATCTTDGNIAYWYCNICSKYFSSSSKSKEITRAETVISAGHSWTEAEELEDRLVPGSGSDCQSAKEYYYGCANCDAVSETEKFTSDVMGSHRMSSEWTFADNAHYHGCTVSGCHYTEDNAPCSGGTATCMDSAVCTVCENAYGTTNPSNHTGNTSRENVRGASCTVNGYTGDTVCECGKTLEAGTVIPAFGHSWDKGTVIKEPSEDETGIRVYVCETCGDTREEEIPKLEHTHNYNAVVTDPTCTKGGYTTYTCKCGDSYVAEETPALGHNEVTDKGYASTCTEPGLTDGSHCDRCGEVMTEQIEIPAIGHSFTNYVSDNNATCTEDGTMTAKCDNCSATDSVTEEDSFLGHSFTNYISDGNATCVQQGTMTATCDRCDTTNTVSDPDTQGDHSYTIVVTPATCTEQGYTTYSCDLCGYSHRDDYTDPVGHNFDGGICVNCNAATRGKCGDNLYWSFDVATGTMTITGKGDMYNYDETDAPWIDLEELILKITFEEGATSVGHWAFMGCENVTELNLPGTLKSLGNWAFYSCTGLKQVDLPEGLVSIGSSFNFCMGLESVVIPDSVEYIGFNAFTMCSSLKSVVIGDGVTIIDGSAFAYDYNLTEVVLGSSVSVICQEAFLGCDSLMEIVLPASVTKIESYAFGSGLQKIIFQGDAPEFAVSVNEDTGEIYANEAFSEAVAIAYYPMNNKTWTPDVMLDYGGDITWIAADCDMLGISHTPADAVTENVANATCTDNGSYDTVIVCSVCDKEISRKTTTTNALGHNEVTDKGYAATCTETGLTDGVHCDRCTEVLTAQEEIPALGHSWDEGVVTKEPTEAETGIRIHTCKVCGETKEEIIPTLDHEHKYTATVTAPTCTEAGYITYTCSCGDSYSEAGKPAAGHTEIIDYGTDATCTESGLTDGSHCNKCGEILTAQEEIPALGHSEVIDASVHATCTETGLTEGKHCDRCDEILVAQKVVPALGHSWDEGIVTKEPTEKETGIKTFTCTVCKQTRTEEIPCVDPVVPEIFRLYGDSRVTTAIAVANKMKEVLGRESFDVILIANGNNFADALTGSYLASVKEAPILLYRSSGAALNEAYIQENLSDDGIVYILGGTEAVPADVEERLTAAGFKVQRLCGDSRYSTNLEILNIAGVSDQEILICTGIDYADSLAASATGLPIVMVNNITGKLTKEQIAFFEAHTDNKFTIVGGNAAVSDELQAKIEAIVGPVERVFGDSRETTSVAIAERYFGTPECVLIAYSRNFPDGLCGGPLANAMGAPLLLVNSRKEAPAAEYVSENGIAKGIVLGGTVVVSEDVVRVVFDIS